MIIDMLPDRFTRLRSFWFPLPVLTGLLLIACATPPPLDTNGVDPALTPSKALVDIEAARNHRVHWGGVIVQSKNLKDTTQIEVLAYPLDKSGIPNTEAEPQARVLVMQAGYLETADYRQGRLVSVVGAIAGIREGAVGEAQYSYPVVNALQLHLWPKQTKPRTGTDVHFGIGIIYSK
jgi:outer membrane lipoprotein